MKTQVMDQVSDPHGNNNGLIRRNASQRAPVDMIEMRVRDQHKVNRRQMMNFEAWLFQPLDHLEPPRPNRIDHDVYHMRLNNKCRLNIKTRNEISSVALVMIADSGGFVIFSRFGIWYSSWISG